MSARIALVISGGGAKGAYAAGAVKYLVTQDCTRFDLYAGTSTGALVTTLALAGGFDELELRYTTSGIADFMQPLDLQGVRQHRGLVDSRPFRRTLEEVYTQAVANRVFAPTAPQLILTAVQLRTGRLVYFHTGGAPGDPRWSEPWEEWHRMGQPHPAADPLEQLRQVLQASGSEPVKFPPVKLWRDGDWYVDGGVRTYTPIKAALAAGATELFILMHSPRNENITVAPDKVDSFPGLVGQTFAVVLANASAMDFAQAHAQAGATEIESRIVAPRQPIVGLGSGPNTLGRDVFNLGFADAERVWGPLLQQRPDLRTQLQGGAPRAVGGPPPVARGLPRDDRAVARRARAPAKPAGRRRAGKRVKDAEAELIAFWTPTKRRKRRRSTKAATKAATKRRSKSRRRRA